VTQKRLGHAGCDFDWNGDAAPPREVRGVNADGPASRIDERAAGKAWIEDRVAANKAIELAASPGARWPGDGADYAERCLRALRVWSSYGKHERADAWKRALLDSADRNIGA
jgi:hypothetical protein